MSTQHKLFRNVKAEEEVSLIASAKMINADLTTTQWVTISCDKGLEPGPEG